MSSVLPDDIAEVREAVRTAARGVTGRHDRSYWVECVREGRFPEAMWQAMADQGLLGLGVPEDLGGSGGGLTEMVAAMEAISEAGTPLVLFLLTAFAREAVLRNGSPEQREQLVGPTTTGELRLSFAITEPDAGTNTFAISTTAAPVGDGSFRLNGTKTFISGADASHKMVVVARTPGAESANGRPGLTLVVVDTNAAGIELSPLDIGIEMSDRQFTVFFTDVRVDAANVIGAPGEGLRYLFDALNPERLLVAAWALGLGEYVMSKAVGYARERAPFGRPIGSYQSLQHPLARARIELDAARLMTYSAAARASADGSSGYLANAAKLMASEAACAACDVAIQAHGGSGFDRGNELITIWPQLRLLRVAPINNEMILNYVGEHVLRLPRSY